MTILVQQQLREATERLIAEGENCWPATVERFTELANPAAVLALLDELDKLKAENEELRRGQSSLEAIATMPADQIRESYNKAYYAPREIGSDAEQIRAGMTAVLRKVMTKEQP